VEISHETLIPVQCAHPEAFEKSAGAKCCDLSLATLPFFRISVASVRRIIAAKERKKSTRCANFSFIPALGWQKM